MDSERQGQELVATPQPGLKEQIEGLPDGARPLQQFDGGNWYYLYKEDYAMIDGKKYVREAEPAQARREAEAVLPVKFVLEKIAHVMNACEAGGHTNRAKMLRALGDEFAHAARANQPAGKEQPNGK
jgi:hypothetical protein